MKIGLTEARIQVGKSLFFQFINFSEFLFVYYALNIILCRYYTKFIIMFFYTHLLSHLLVI